VLLRARGVLVHGLHGELVGALVRALVGIWAPRYVKSTQRTLVDILDRRINMLYGSLELVVACDRNTVAGQVGRGEGRGAAAEAAPANVSGGCGRGGCLGRRSSDRLGSGNVKDCC
jgi:hypothetical protein